MWRRVHPEHHQVSRIGWLRAAVLGANDGIVSTASLIIGVAAASAPRSAVVIAGLAGLAAGAMSMAAGEYVSVSSQADTERADLERERAELAACPTDEHDELAGIYRDRGLDAPTADAVAAQLMAKDALAAHGRDELGISEISTARPVQAALTSATTFTAGALAPLVIALVVPTRMIVPAVASASLLALVSLGAIGARAGGADAWRAMARVLFWGALAMAATAGIGRLAGAVV
jgi:VIT1/CCC1 family predicted Fe2+/Mn2+ transporter